MSVIDFPPPVNAVSADASTIACPVTAGQVVASAAASRGSSADTYTYAALKASSVTARCTIINPFTADVATVRSHHLVLRLGVDAHHARVAVGDSLAVRVFVEKGLHI